MNKNGGRLPATGKTPSVHSSDVFSLCFFVFDLIRPPELR